MNLYDLSYQKNLAKINQLNKNGYMQINQNDKLFSKNNLDEDDNKTAYLSSYRTQYSSNINSLNQVNNYSNYNSNIKNKRKKFSHKRKELSLNEMYKIKDNEYIYNISMNNFNKYKDYLVEEDKNKKIYKQMINKNLYNNIINPDMLKPKISKNNFNNFHQRKNNECTNNLENDMPINNELTLPLPEPIPIKVTKYSSYIKQIKKPSLSLNNYEKYENNFNYNTHKNYKKFNRHLSYNNFNNEINSNKIEHLLANKNISENNLIFNISNCGENNNNDNNKDSKLKFVLEKLDMMHLINIFEINYIKFNDLFLLKKEDFIEMKIPIGSRNKLMFFIQEYKKIMKNNDLEELSYFFNLYNNHFLYMNDSKSAGNIPPSSTMPTTINEFSSRINGTSFLNNHNNKNYLENSKESSSHINNINNCSTLNSSNLCKRFNDDKSILERNKINLRNLKTTSFLTSQTNENNSKNSKTNVLNIQIKNDKKDTNQKDKLNSNMKNEKNFLDISNNRKRSRHNNKH